MLFPFFIVVKHLTLCLDTICSVRLLCPNCEVCAMVSAWKAQTGTRRWSVKCLPCHLGLLAGKLSVFTFQCNSWQHIWPETKRNREIGCVMKRNHQKSCSTSIEFKKPPTGRESRWYWSFKCAPTITAWCIYKSLFAFSKIKWPIG